MPGRSPTHRPAGCGKTHLLQAVARTTTDTIGQDRVVFMTGDVLLEELLTAIRTGSRLRSRVAGLRHRLLILDQAENLTDLAHTQEQVGWMLRGVISADTAVLIASGRPPDFLADVLSRTIGLTLVTMQLPGRRHIFRVLEQCAPPGMSTANLRAIASRSQSVPEGLGRCRRLLLAAQLS